MTPTPLGPFRRPAATVRAVAAGLTVLAVAACTASDQPAESLLGTDVPVTTGESPTVIAGRTVLDPIVDRAAHTASLLPDGQVLLVGGCVVDGCSEATTHTELYDPASGRFSTAAALAEPRDGHTATALPNGDVLVVGGYSGEGRPPLASAELYLAAEQRFVPVGEMSVGRGAHAAALLADGRVLVAGGWTGPRTFSDTAEIWDPLTRSFTSVAPLATARGGATATLLGDGRVLLVGGEDEPAHGLASTEVYDAAADTWLPGPDLAGPRFKHAAVALPSGDVLVIGGTPDDDVLLTAIERFDGSAFQPAGELAEGRYKLSDAVVALPDGRVLVAGGGRSAETYDPVSGLVSTVATGTARSSFATATVLGDGSVLVVGGYDEAIDLRRAAYLLQT